MARKNVFGFDEGGPKLQERTEEAPVQNRPLANFERPAKRSGPVGAISQSLEGINEKAQRASALERQLAEGQLVVELDPATIDSSFVPDRLGVENEDRDLLVSQIREHGQQVPILVRPHPDQQGRFQVAYGHRRLAAVRELGFKVRAVVRKLSDEQLVVSQGQENNTRTDLSFIERAFFGYRLEKRGFGRDIIMSALGVDKAALSRMIALIERLPAALIEAVGRAPGYGRARWAEMADILERKTNEAVALEIVASRPFLEKSSDGRFEYLFRHFRAEKEKARVSTWNLGSRHAAVRISETEDRLNLTFDKSIETGFGAFVESRLDALYQDFLRNKQVGD